MNVMYLCIKKHEYTPKNILYINSAHGPPKWYF